MDVDCDGSTESGPVRPLRLTCGADTAQCHIDPTHQGITDATWHNKPIDAQKVPYVVMCVLYAGPRPTDPPSNDDKYFRPSKLGIKQLSPVGVVCKTKSGPKMTFGVFADTNPLGEVRSAR